MMENNNRYWDQVATPAVTLCHDGKYRWRYEVNLVKNWSFFWLVWKILFCIFMVIFLFVFLTDVINWGLTPERVVANLKFLGYFLTGMTMVCALGYLLYAAIMGGKYCVVFEMDDSGINHRQTENQAKKARQIAKATMLAGAASGRIGTVGAGINAARTEMYSDFAKVRKLKAYPRKHLLKVNGRFSRNQVYVRSEDFEFVLNFITAHCPNAV